MLSESTHMTQHPPSVARRDSVQAQGGGVVVDDRSTGTFVMQSVACGHPLQWCL